jgi:hypothetical protein
MTYGEYYYMIKHNMKLVNGEWIVNKPDVAIPLRMSKKQANIYYTQKFRNYWKSKNQKTFFDS